MLRRLWVALMFWAVIAPMGFVLYFFGWKLKRLDEEERPPQGDEVQIQAQDPDEDHDDRKRSYGHEIWLPDLTCQERLSWSDGCFNQEQAQVGIPVVPVEKWYADKKAREAALRN